MFEKHSVIFKDKNENTAEFSAVFQSCWRLSIVPGRLQPSIVDINELNFCVRDGNRWTLVIIDTNYSVAVVLDGLDIITHLKRKCKPFFKIFRIFLNPLGFKRRA